MAKNAINNMFDYQLNIVLPQFVSSEAFLQSTWPSQRCLYSRQTPSPQSKLRVAEAQSTTR